MIDAVRKVIAAYHDAPEAICQRCDSSIWGAVETEKGIHGVPGLAEAMEELEGILTVLDEVIESWRLYCIEHKIPQGVSE